MNARIGTQEAVTALRAAGYGVTQMEKGTLIAFKGKQSYGLPWRSTAGGKGYNRQAIAALAPLPATLA